MKSLDEFKQYLGAQSGGCRNHAETVGAVRRSLQRCGASSACIEHVEKRLNALLEDVPAATSIAVPAAIAKEVTPLLQKQSAFHQHSFNVVLLEVVVLYIAEWARENEADD